MYTDIDEFGETQNHEDQRCLFSFFFGVYHYQRHPVAMGDKAICIIHIALYSVLLAALVIMMGKMKITATVMQLHLQNPQFFNLSVARVPTWESINGGQGVTP